MAVRMTPYSLGFDPLVVGLPVAVSFFQTAMQCRMEHVHVARVWCVSGIHSHTLLSRAFIACRRGDTDTRKHTDVDRGQNARFQSTRQDW